MKLKEDNTLPNLDLTKISSKQVIFMSERKTEHGEILPKTKKIPLWKIHKMFGRE